MAEDALARAREIAAKLSGKFTALNNNTFMILPYVYILLLFFLLWTSSTGGLAGSDLGKRKNRWDDEPGGSSGPGCKNILFWLIIIRCY